MKKIIFYSLLLMPALAFSQDLNLVGSASTIQKSVEQLMPIVAGIGLLYVGFRNLNNFKEGGDVLEGLKAIFWYLLIAGAIIAAYKFVISQSI